MTVRLLRPFEGYSSNAIVTLDRATESALVSQLAATTSLTGGFVWTPNGPLGAAPMGAENLSLTGNPILNQGVLQSALTAGGTISIVTPGTYPVVSDSFTYADGALINLGPGVRFSVAGVTQKLSSIAPVTTGTQRAGIAKRPNTVLLVGDSITQNNTTTGDLSSYHNTIGCFTWANAYMGQRLDIVANLGVGGMSAGDYQTNSLRSNICGYLSTYESAYVACLIGTNDVAAGRTGTQLISDLDYIIKACADDGKVILLSTILPRLSGGSGLTAAQRNVLMAVNAWIRERNMRTDGCLVSDPFRYAADPASSVSDPFSNETYDSGTVGLHPAPTMAMRVGTIWASDWGAFIPQVRRFVGGAGDAYDSTNNQYGNLLTNGTVQTLSATSGTGFAGNNPTGWTIQRVIGAGTWTGSAVARTDGVPGNWYQAAITLESNANAQYQMRQNTFGPNGGGSNTYAIGDRVYADAEIKITHSGSTNYVKGVYVTATEYDRDGNVVFVAAGPYRTTLTNPLQRAVDYTITARSPEFVSRGSSGTGGASQRITTSIDVLFDGSVSAALTVSIGQVGLRKVVS